MTKSKIINRVRQRECDAASYRVWENGRIEREKCMEKIVAMQKRINADNAELSALVAATSATKAIRKLDAMTAAIRAEQRHPIKH